MASIVSLLLNGVYANQRRTASITVNSQQGLSYCTARNGQTFTASRRVGDRLMNRCRNLCTVLTLLALLAQGCATSTHNLPPAQQLLESGPGVGGPGPGVMGPVSAVIPADAQAPMPGAAGAPMISVAPQPTVQLQFARPEAMQTTHLSKRCPLQELLKALV